MITYTIPSNLRALLEKYGYLGFDYCRDACAAILTHDDWCGRWDFSEFKMDEIVLIALWKEETLAKLN
jgi:hypothetical protein